MFWRLFGTYALLLLATVGFLGTIVVGRVERYHLERIEESLRTKAILIREAVRDRPESQAQAMQERITALRTEIATRITLLAADGRVLADSEEDPGEMENHARRSEVEAARVAGIGTATRYSNTLGQRMMYVALRTDDERGATAFVRVALPLTEVQEQVGTLRRLVVSAAALTGLAAVALALGLARRITRPLQELTAEAERIAAGDYGGTVLAHGRDEVGTLARTFNGMSRRLAAQFAQLAEDRQQLRMILGGMVEGVIALDAEQRILFANERAGRLLAFNVAAATGRKLWEVVRRRALQDVVKRSLSEPEPCWQELSWNEPAARSLTVHAARLPGSPTRGAVLVLHDTTELRRLERVRQEFVANVSHELKTPLSVIKACIETLLEGAVDDPQHRGTFLEQIASQADRLQALILDLLSLARIESGRELFEFQSVPLGPVVVTCLERHRARADGKQLVLEAVPPEPAEAAEECAAWADEEAICQILDNLVDNALKYTPEGGRIRVRWRAKDDHVVMEVEDTGIGIPEADLPRIFERFYRVDKARSRELGGTGLGLSIVKHLAQAMQGSVRAASQPGGGSTFTVRLPRAPVS